MIRLPGVEHGVKRGLIVEITVAAIDRQLRRGNCHQHGTGPALDDLVPRAWRDDDHFVAKASRRAELSLDISANAAAVRRIEG